MLTKEHNLLKMQGKAAVLFPKHSPLSLGISCFIVPRIHEKNYISMMIKYRMTSVIADFFVVNVYLSNNIHLSFTQCPNKLHGVLKHQHLLFTLY